MKALIIFLSLFCMAKPQPTAKSPQRKPNNLENIKKIKVRIRVHETQSLFEITFDSKNTVVIFHSQFGKTHTSRSPLRDFKDLGNIFLAPAADVQNCKGSLIIAEAFMEKTSQAQQTITDCFDGTSASSKEKTQTAQILARLGIM